MESATVVPAMVGITKPAVVGPATVGITEALLTIGTPTTLSRLCSVTNPGAGTLLL